MLLLLGAVQFVNILDFMIVMPLGPDFARALRIPIERIAFISASYALAAGVAGLIGSRFLDRFDRRRALAVAMFGLVIATAMGGMAQGLGTLIAARMLAGCFGGPASSLTFSILSDAVPPERRGRAIGMVMAAFSVASVIGVPSGLWLASLGSWRTPFFSVALMGLLVAGSAISILPPLRGHLDAKRKDEARFLRNLARRPAVLLCWAMTGAVMMANFALVPYVSPFIQLNLGFPRAHLQYLYMAGGTVGFTTQQIAGYLADRFGELRVTLGGTLVLELVLLTGFALTLGVPVPAIFLGYMLSTSFRTVPLSSIASKVPRPWERAKFLSIQSAVQHFASALGAFASSRILHSSSPTAPIEGMPRVALLCMLLTAVIPVFMWQVKRQLVSSPH